MSWTQEYSLWDSADRAIENVDLLVLSVLIKVEMLSSVDMSFDRVEIRSKFHHFRDQRCNN